MKKRAVIQLKDGKKVGKFNSCRSVRWHEEDFDPSCVSRCCNGERELHKGYSWQWYDIWSKPTVIAPRPIRSSSEGSQEVSW